MLPCYQAGQRPRLTAESALLWLEAFVLLWPEMPDVFDPFAFPEAPEVLLFRRPVALEPFDPAVFEALS